VNAPVSNFSARKGEFNMCPSPTKPDAAQKSQWSKIYDLLASPQSLAAVGVVATGALLWYNKDALITNGVKLGAKAVAGIGTRMFSPTTAANFVLDKFAKSLDQAATPGENLMIAVKGYASLMIPGGNLTTNALFQGIKLWWNGISPMQSFALDVYQELPTEWRNQFSIECVKGLAAIAAGTYLQTLSTAAEVLSSANPPW
jgi:hypothetical protein